MKGIEKAASKPLLSFIKKSLEKNSDNGNNYEMP